ncbi:MAG: DVU_1553 family AMP-dependent CoA ligase [Desulfovibrio sp.]
MASLPWLERWLLEALWPEDFSDAARAPIRPEELRNQQWERLRRTMDHARRNSPYYRQHWRHAPKELPRNPEELAAWPRTPSRELCERPESFLAVSQDEVARVVSIPSSGTSGPGKRIFFTPGDLKRIRHFFGRGMRNLVRPGETTLVLLPGERPDSVGRLLGDALESFGSRALVAGPLEHPHDTLRQMDEQQVRCIVGSPAHIHVLAAHARFAKPARKPRVRSVLLCWDAAPQALVRSVEQGLDCAVFHHWGMVETGLGGAVECAPGSGMHLREADLYVEIACPHTGRPQPHGQWGEILVTTLTRRAMPLIRYRTGDRGRLLPGPCACGSALQRLDQDVRRLAEDHGNTSHQNGRLLDVADLGDVLYAVHGLADFAASWRRGKSNRPELHIEITTPSPPGSTGEQAVLQRSRTALDNAPALRGSGIPLRLRTMGHGGTARPGLDKRVLYPASDFSEEKS